MTFPMSATLRSKLYFRSTAVPAEAAAVQSVLVDREVAVGVYIQHG
jgi:hypothetical protein